MTTLSSKGGCLYVVATPIGNLSDISERAVKTLTEVDIVAAEDTRHSQRLLNHLGIRKRLVSVHDHNERLRIPILMRELQDGKSVALISDAGTPLISDPGFQLVNIAHQKDIQVVPIPGPNAAITALSVAGLATDHFCFEGFLPARASQRKTRLGELKTEQRTLVFYESAHRIIDMLSDLGESFGAERLAAICRELTKKHESLYRGDLAILRQMLEADKLKQKGEFVVIVEGAAKPVQTGLSEKEEHILTILLQSLSLKQAVALAVQITGLPHRLVYQRALELRES